MGTLVSDENISSATFIKMIVTIITIMALLVVFIIINDDQLSCKTGAW